MFSDSKYKDNFTQQSITKHYTARQCNMVQSANLCPFMPSDSESDDGNGESGAIYSTMV